MAEVEKDKKEGWENIERERGREKFEVERE
jgi:hypothetical protein